MKITSPKLIYRLLASGFLVFCGVAAMAQSPQMPQPLNDNPGKDSLEYTLDVRTLKDSNHKIFWKRDDSIRIYVANNPFIFKYTLKFDDVLVKEDDPLGAFGGKFGLNTAAVSPSTGGSAHKTSSDQTNANAGAKLQTTIDAANLKSAASALPASDLNEKFALTVDADRILALDPSSPSTAETRQVVINDAKANIKKIDDRNRGKKSADRDNTAPVTQALNSLEHAEVPRENTPDLSSLHDADKRIARMMAILDNEYANFANQVQLRLAVLTDPSTPLDMVKKVATKLSVDSTQEANCLSVANFDDTYTKLTGCPENVNSNPPESITVPSIATNLSCQDSSTHSLLCQLLDFAYIASILHEQVEQSLPARSASSPSESSAISRMDELHTKAGDVVSVACKYQAFIDSNISSIRSGLITPLDSVLNDGLSFGYEYPNAAVQREGPFVDPTAVTMTLHRDPVAPFTNKDNSSKLEVSTDSYTCSGDPGDLVTNGSTYKELADFFSDKPAKSRTDRTGAASEDNSDLYTRNPNKPVLKGKITSTSQKPADSTTGNNGASTKPATSDATKPATLTQPWIFGKPRLVVSGGIGSALLSKQEFQRSMSISGTTTQTVIGLKTNSKIRVTPMLYGHTYLSWLNTRHDPDGFYATFGVTANSDNKGTDPEFLFGLSRSFVQQRFFLTAGAYLGERQKLDGGLYVGEVIPSSFTTDLPVTKSYHTGFGFGVSYRFTSTKTPQDNKQSNTSGKVGKP